MTQDLPNLDFLRAVAVGLVFAEHMMNVMKIRGLGDIGHFGVLLFFVHTSLVLMLSIERLGLSGQKLFTTFMVRRIFRIYPLSIFIILLFISFSIPSVPWAGRFVQPGWQELISNFLLVQNITQSRSINCVLWSLPFEVQMYVVLPLIYSWTRHFPSLLNIFVIWLAGVGAAGLEYVLRSGKCDPDFLLLRYFPCFLAGVFAWRLMANRTKSLPGGLWVFVLMFLVALYRLVDALRVYGPNLFVPLSGALRNDHRIWWPPYLDLASDWVFCCLSGIAIPLFANISNDRLNKLSKKIAQYSYGIYVCHIPILWLCFIRLHLGYLAASAILSIFLTALVSFALYHCIEDPAIRFGKLLTTRLTDGIALA
ncbi:acyltransferase family protein [Acidicapsa acidisoli]|uniref:acyltransferase family protein n=1 Tax=Acidicapsa acidisoli TaxID=1615681 RepID=UPI0021DF8FCF|nr:acyltransferase [Acidicapsa acidisoli]